MNLRLPQAPSLRLTQIPRIRSFAQIIQPPKLAQKKEAPRANPDGAQGDEGVDPVKPVEKPKINPYDGLFHNVDGSKDFSTGGKVGGVNNWA